MNLRYTIDRQRLKIDRTKKSKRLTNKQADKLKSKVASGSTSALTQYKSGNAEIRNGKENTQKSAIICDQTAKMNESQQNLTQSSLFESEAMERSFREYLIKYDPPPSPMPNNISKKEQLQWLRQRRNVGLWVMCDKCKKYRYLKDTTDPLDLPDKWYCSMNPGNPITKKKTLNDYSYIRSNEELLHI